MSGVRTRGMTKSAADSSREMHIIAKAASIGDPADWLARSQQCLSMHKMCGTIRALRIDEFAACRAAHLIDTNAFAAVTMSAAPVIAVQAVLQM
jgi:hypothetical protein